MRGVFAQIRQRGRLNQGHRGTPEKCHQCQHQQHAPKARGKKNTEVAHRAYRRGKLYYQQTLAGVVSQPAPQVWRDHAHHGLHGHQDRNLDCVKMNGLEIQTPVRGEHPDEGVVEKIEPGDAPVVIFAGSHLLKYQDWMCC